MGFHQSDAHLALWPYDIMKNQPFPSHPKDSHHLFRALGPERTSPGSGFLGL